MLNQRLSLIVFAFFLFCATLVVAQQQVITVGVYNNPPKLLLDDGELTGIHGDLLLEIAQQHNWRLVLKACQWQQCLQWLDEGEIDLLPDVAKTDFRSQRFRFHQEPALLSWSQIYADRQQQIASLLDLNGKRVAVLSDSVQQDYLRNLAQRFNLNVDFLPVASFDDGFDALQRNYVDAVATNQFFGNQKVAEAEAAITPIMFLPNELYFAIGNDANQSLLTAIDESLTALKADPASVYYAIIERWSAQSSESRLPTWLWWLVIALCAVLIISLVFVRLLKLAVNRRTRELQDSEKKLETILGSVDAYIFIKGIDLTYQYVNDRVADMFKRDAKDVVGVTDYDLFDLKTAQQITDNDKEVLQTGRRLARHELNQIPGENKTRAYWSVKVPLKNSDGKIVGLCGISTDVSEYEELKQQIEQLAFYDVLTGLANRRMLLEKVMHHYKNSERNSALLLIDVDKFKTINDALGHEQGDELLRQLASRIEALVGSSELGGRLASDEFYILFDDLPNDSVSAQALVQTRLQQLQQELSTRYTLADKQQLITLCFAVSFFDEAETAEHLLKAVDLAMTQAKLVGPGSVQFYSSQLQQDFNRRQQIESGLRAAVAHDRLTVYLQPQFTRNEQDDALTCVGFEALLRWYDPQLGPVSPGEFIPVAETAGLMPQLHQVVLAKAVAAIERLHSHPNYSGCSIAINISASQFNDAGFYQQFERLVEQNPAAKYLELELTESMLISDADRVAATMDELTRLGLSLSLDDFGTGYSALSYLKRLPLKQLKIDQSFVRDLLSDRNDEAIIATIVALAKSLGLQVLAEGVEEPSQLERLREMGCTRYQGFLLGHPEPLEHWLKQ